MSKTHRRGIGRTAEEARRRRKRPCISAPSAPANLVQKIRKVHSHHRHLWTLYATWDPVTTDVAGRDLTPERYQVQMRATDASGEPVETPGQTGDPTIAYGSTFTGAGTTVINKTELKLDHSATAKATITGLTAGIECQVDFYLRTENDTDSLTARCFIYNVTDAVEVTGKNGDPEDKNKPRLLVSQSFTPAFGKTYEARVTYVNGTGKAILGWAEWHDKGNVAIWKKMLAGDDTDAIFGHLFRPKAWYYQVRVRAQDVTHGHKCWSAWTAWTTPQNPATKDYIGPPAPDGLLMTFDKVEGSRRHAFRAVTRWNETPWWQPPDGEPEEGADHYTVQFATSNDGGTTTSNTRHNTIRAKDEDANVTCDLEWKNIRRSRVYRFRVRASADKRRGAWSAWTTWASPIASIGIAPDPPTNVHTFKPRARVLRTTWDEPADPNDVDRYRVRVFNQGVLRDVDFTRGMHHRYMVPEADKGTAHRVWVTAIDDDGNMSTEVSEGSDTVDDGAGGGADRPAPDQVVINNVFYAVHKRKRRLHYSARVKFNAVTTPAGVQVGHYVAVRVSCDSGGTPIDTDADGTANFDRVIVHKPDDGDTVDVLKAMFRDLPRPQTWYVKFRVRAVEENGLKGPWSTWTTPALPSAQASAPPSPISGSPALQPQTTARRWKWIWQEPTNEDAGVDRYLAEVQRNDSGIWNTVETAYTRGTHYSYHAPYADKDKTFRLRVTTVNESGVLSTGATDAGGTAYPDSGVPPGTIKGYGGGTAPDGWLKCNGASYSTAAYPDLFAIIGYQFGGSLSTFQVPDLRKRGLRGLATSGDSMGDTEGQIESDRNNPEHGIHAEHVTHGPHSGHNGHGNHGNHQNHGGHGGHNGHNAHGGHRNHGGHDGHGNHDSHFSDSQQDDASHSHNTGNTTSQASSGPASGGTGTPTDLTRLGHTHTVVGYTQGRNANHAHPHSTKHDYAQTIIGHSTHVPHSPHNEHLSYEHDWDTVRGHGDHDTHASHIEHASGEHDYDWGTGRGHGDHNPHDGHQEHLLHEHDEEGPLSGRGHKPHPHLKCHFIIKT